MGAILISLTLLSVLSSLIVLVGSVVSTLRSRRRRGHASTARQLLADLNDRQRLQLWICLLDVLLLLAASPLFVIHAKRVSGADSIWETAFKNPTATFSTTAALVIRPAVFAMLATNAYLKGMSKRRWQLPFQAAAAVLVASIATISAARCVSMVHGASTCAAVPFTNIGIITAQIAFAAVATFGLMWLHSSSSKTKVSTTAANHLSRIAHRAPSLSLLIHTQPDPWTRHIDLDSPIKTDFGPPTRPDPPNIEYGPNFVRGILEDTMASGRTNGAVTASLGYNSAAASSANPYQIGSAFSVASRDALNSLGASSRDLIGAGPGQDPRYATTSTSKSSSANPGPHGQACFPSRTPSPALFDDTSRPLSRLSQTATEELLRGPKTNAGNPPQSSTAHPGASSSQLVLCLASLWCPIALSTAALLLSASNMQACILLSVFCFPASVLLVQELVVGCHRRKRTLTQQKLVPQFQRQSVEAPSARASIASSAVIVYVNSNSLRDRRPHIRSRSCPLESELNGYGDYSLGVPSRKRQSLSSAKSVPYLSKHWAAGKVSGDRVVAPRSSFVRGLNLMLNPKPKLEVLPVSSSEGCCFERTARASNNNIRQSTLSTAVTSAVVQGLLEAPHVQGLSTSDSEQTRIMHDHSLNEGHASSSMVSLQISEVEPQSVDSMSRLTSQSRDDDVAGRSAGVILDMDVTPGSPRRQAGVQPIGEHSDLQSPIKRQIPASSAPTYTPKKVEAYPTASPSFSCNEDSQLINNSASRLFSEIMDMVQGNKGTTRMSDQNGLTFNQSLRRTPPKGYACIDEEHGPKEVSVYDSANEDGGTVVIHSTDSSGDFRSAASQGMAQTTMASQSLSTSGTSARIRHDGGDRTLSWTTSTIELEHAEAVLVRKASTSSTLSFTSISSRIRSLRRTASGTSGSPFESPRSISRDEHHQVKKIRSRTFASAFGIELGLLSRNGSKGKGDASGSFVESSPSTSAGTCPSSLMDLSFSPSPASHRQAARLFNDQQDTPSPDGGLDTSLRRGVKKAHRRNPSRADSIMDMLDKEGGDTMEEMLDSVDAAPCAAQVDEPISKGGSSWDVAEVAERVGRSEEYGQAFDGQAVELDKVCEVDLADVTVNDVWQRSFERDHGRLGHDPALAAQLGHEERVADGEVEEDLIGFDKRRLVARAPFLDTVEEESEDETVEKEVSLEGRPKPSQYQVGQMQDLGQDVTANDDVRDTSSSWNSDAERCADASQDNCGLSRESLLQEREAEQRRVAQLLMEHEAMFPHKTLSRIEEATEVASTLRSSGFRTISATSSSKLGGDKTSSEAEADSIRLGLPLSLACQQDAEFSESDTSGSKSTTAADTSVADASEESDESQDVEERLLPFVTPRSHARRQAAAGRRAAFDANDALETHQGTVAGSQSQQAHVDPSPRSVNVRLGQLGMDQGIWLQSPVKLQLDESASGSVGGGDLVRDSNDDSRSAIMVDTTSGEGIGRTTRLRRSLTLSKKLSNDSKGAMRKLVRLDHHDSPKREMRNRLAKQTQPRPSTRLSQDGPATKQGFTTTTNSSPMEKRLLHRPIKKRRKSRIKGVAVMIARHQFTVVDEDDSLIQRFSSAQPGGPSDS